MNNVFITGVSLQGKGGLNSMIYEPDFELEKNVKTSFPIVPIVASHLDESENVKVIAIRQENSDTPDNFEALKKELYALGIAEDQIQEIVMLGDADRKNTIDMMLDLIDAIPEYSMIYEDCTYGTKTASAMMLFAMILAEKMKKVEVQGIFYGEMIRKAGIPTGEAKLHDITAYKALIDVAETLNEMGVSDIREAMEKLLK